MMLLTQQVTEFCEKTPIYLNTKYVRHFSPISYPGPLGRGTENGTQCQMEHASAIIIDMPFDEVVGKIEGAKV